MHTPVFSHVKDRVFLPWKTISKDAWNICLLSKEFVWFGKGTLVPFLKIWVAFNHISKEYD